MKYITFYRRDFKEVEDGSGASFFDDLLYSVGIKKEEWEDIDNIELYVRDESFSINT